MEFESLIRKIIQEELVKMQKPEPQPEPEQFTFIERKRASFDIDADLLKELKIHATNTEQHTYEIVEKALREFLREGK